jgi:hypothetical protein
VIAVDLLRQMTTAIEEIRALHTDSVIGFCPTCFRAADVSDTDDGLVAWPCPTLRALGFQPVELKPSSSLRTEIDGEIV